LNVGVGVRLVVVQDDQEVVIDMRQRRRDGRQAHVRAAAVTAERDYVNRLIGQLAFAHEHFESCRGAERG
jgi:hypothetical protein